MIWKVLGAVAWTLKSVGGDFLDTRIFLEKIKSGEIDINEGEEILKKLPYEDLGFAKLDHHR